MAIKILKEGQKEFAAHCIWCGCEFTYEISDLRLSAAGDKLECPTCGKAYYHNVRARDPVVLNPQPSIPFTTYNDPCEGCAWKDFSNQNWNYVGDTPCTWCTKKQVTNTVPTGITISGADRTPCNCDATSTCSSCAGSTGTTTANLDLKKFKEKTVDIDLTCLYQGDVWKSCNDCGAENSCCGDSESSCACKHTK